MDKDVTMIVNSWISLSKKFWLEYGEYPNRKSSKSNNINQKIKCKISIGNQYYEFNPSEIDKVLLDFSSNSKNVILQSN